MRSIRGLLCVFVLALVTSVAPGGEPSAGSPGSAVAASRIEQFHALKARAEQQGELAVIVRFDQFAVPLPDLPPQAQQARMDAIQALQGRLLADLAGWGSLNNVKRFQFSPYVGLTADARVLGVLEHHPLALEVVEDELRAPSLKETILLIHADTGAWNSGLTGLGQTVAILDSGVDKNHPFLAGKVVSEACYSTTSSFYGSTSLCPGGLNSTATGSGANCSGISGCDHGTHVAGIAAGKDPGGTGRNGVAKDANLIAIQVFSRFDGARYCGTSSPCILSFSSDQKLALERVYVLRNTYPNAIASANLSLGGGRYYANCDSDSLKPSIDNLRAIGTAVAIASGNNGYADSISAPACISSAISVGSTCDAGGSYCTAVDAVAGYSNIASFVSLLAPGSLVTSSVPGGGYASWHGTSMATPHVAGAWALKKQQSSSATVSATLDDFRANGVVVNDTRSGGTVTGMRRINFVPAATYTLTVTNGGNGTVTSAPSGIACPSTCSAAFAAGTSVTLTASPAVGYQFAGWAGACTGTGNCVVTMTANTSVSASFSAVPNNAPIAVGETYGVQVPNTLTVTAPGVLSNDNDPDGNALTAVLASPPSKGVLSLAATGGFTYTPNANASGADTFTYQASDGLLPSNTATVTLNIASCAAPSAPTSLTAKALPKLRIQLAWTDTSSNEAGFAIERSVNGGAWVEYFTVGTNVTSYTNTGLTLGVTYSYRVKANGGSCGYSGYTNTASATAKR